MNTVPEPQQAANGKWTIPGDNRYFDTRHGARVSLIRKATIAKRKAQAKVANGDARGHEPEPPPPVAAPAVETVKLEEFVIEAAPDSSRVPQLWRGTPEIEPPPAAKVADAIDSWDLSYHLGTVVDLIGSGTAGRQPPTVETLKKALWHLEREIARRGG